MRKVPNNFHVVLMVSGSESAKVLLNLGNCCRPYHGHGQKRLSSKALAGGTKCREPRSGTGDAIPRCLQRFARFIFILILLSYNAVQTLGPIEFLLKVLHNNR